MSLLRRIRFTGTGVKKALEINIAQRGSLKPAPITPLNESGPLTTDSNTKWAESSRSQLTSSLTSSKWQTATSATSKENRNSLKSSNAAGNG
jgi:hypothetical protein